MAVLEPIQSFVGLVPNASPTPSSYKVMVKVPMKDYFDKGLMVIFARK